MFLHFLIAQVTAEASATPPDSPESSATARNTLQLRVSECSATGLNSTVSIVPSPPEGRSSPSVIWSADTQVDWLNSLDYQESKTLTYNVSWTKVDALTTKLSGDVMISNPTAAAISIKSASVQPEFASSAAGTAAAAAAPPSIEAQCKDTAVAPGASISCSYSGTVPGGGPGSLVAEAVLSSGQVIYSAPISFQLPSSTSQTGSRGSAGGRRTAAECAEVITGLFLSPALLLPDRTKDNSAQQSKACDSGSKQVSVTVGPFREDECGQYTVSCG